MRRTILLLAALMQPAHVEAALRGSADDLGAPGLDPFYGHGRVNAARALP